MQLLRCAGLLILAVVDASRHSNHLSKCVHRCEHENACQSSLEAQSCEANCKSICDCFAKSRHMLNKPRHCQPAMLEEMKKQLSLIRGKVHISKVKLAETESQPDEQFEGYIALEDFWPKASEAPHAKPQMLNGHSMSLLNKKAPEPWSAAVHPRVRRHGFLVQTGKLASKNMTNASKVASNASRISNASKVAAQKMPETSNASKAVLKKVAPQNVSNASKVAHAKK
eukprot:gnl/MRDRNA2_/MRDRNA2_89557_c0_seq1.p1 gnl/MRDRNA2_/MRDRNA2_89557_c0~~gnl/MRDRNA2_/MRDRNA2_89557_c0_seq1.p1  ORF type:complete len:227 (+),score=50.50 gnl/MRDRNA2_/MRDRNA2_89557_c0_seq1:77-757(+)